MWRRRETQLALLGALLIFPGLLFDEILGLHHWLIDVTSVGALIAAGVPIFRSAVQAIRIGRTINMNVLMSIAAIGAVIIGEYTEAGMVIVLFAIAEALEGYTTSRARDSIRSLIRVVPNEATLLDRGHDHVHEKRVPVETLSVGDVISVKPGERIPMDGRVVAGASSVNQAPITGESRLVEKVEGSEVFASSINGEGSLEIEVMYLAADNTISRLIRMVEEAQEKRAPTQRFVDRFARYYTPAIVALAALTAVVPPLLFGQPFLNPDERTFGWLYRGLALLVVGCPCALVISTPVSIISAISSGARNGVLIKGGAYLEALNGVNAVALDKTGTLTEGNPSVVTVHSTECLESHAKRAEPACSEGWEETDGVCHKCDDVVALASAVEQRSEHPVARAIIDEAARRGVQSRYPAAKMVTAMAGRGVTGEVQGRQVTIGSHDHFDATIPHPQEHCGEAEYAGQQGYTPMMVSADGEYLGTITVADTIRATSQEAVALLKQAGINSIIMLTGDNTYTAHAVGEEVGVTDIRAQLMPEDKVAAVEALREEYGTVAMVGDGINDAPALATADVGIAIGAASGGTAQAMETADIALMTDDLRRLPFAFRLSRTTMRTIRGNVAFAIGIKLVFLVLVLLGLGTMWMAILADMGASLLVTLNGMRLLQRRSE
jgi:Cd2+/Zn2+-exporting ATPase